MNAQAKSSAKGQLVTPKDVRDRSGFKIGEVVDVIETSDGGLPIGADAPVAIDTIG